MFFQSFAGSLARATLESAELFVSTIILHPLKRVHLAFLKDNNGALLLNEEFTIKENTG